MASPVPALRCRQIVEDDIENVATLLARGFPNRNRAFWLAAFRQLRRREPPSGLPKYGYLLESDGVPVGALLLICSQIRTATEVIRRCNVSSWYVEPAFRAYAAMLVSRAVKHNNITYFNITPASGTVPILEAQGYVRYCAGRFVSVPALSAWSYRFRVKAVDLETRPGDDLPPSEVDLLLAHTNYGCASLVCSSGARRHPFVFVLARKFGLVPYAYLAYCRDLEDFVRFAGPLGRFLARRGFPVVVLDSNGPVRGLIGRYSANFPKYFKGPDRPRLGDVAYSERAMFGF